MQYDWEMSARWADLDVDRARWRGTIMRRLHPRLALGVEINPGVEEFGPLATLFLLTETHARPSLSLGTSSDRIGSPEGETSVFLTAAKKVPRVPVAPYVSLNWSEWDDGFNVPFGASFFLGSDWSLRPMYDGERTHLMASFSRGPVSVTALWIWLEEAGLAISWGFGGGDE